MNRFSAVTAILICVTFSVPRPALSQSSSATDHGCFPWQEFRGGECVAKRVQEPRPLPGPAASDTPPPPPPAAASSAPPAPPVIEGPCFDGGYRNSIGQCVCPAGTRVDNANARCLADTVTRAPDNIVCDGGTVSNGSCVCPAGFNLMTTAGSAGSFCARTNAESCLGGQLTVNGKCLCNGQVTMSGVTYLLEYSNGKCLPMRCPVTELLRDGKCGPITSAEPSVEPETKGQPAPKEARDTRDSSGEGEPRRRCGRGMVLTRSGCAPAHRNLNDFYRPYYRY